MDFTEDAARNSETANTAKPAFILRNHVADPMNPKSLQRRLCNRLSRLAGRLTQAPLQHPDYTIGDTA